MVFAQMYNIVVMTYLKDLPSKAGQFVHVCGNRLTTIF